MANLKINSTRTYQIAFTEKTEIYTQTKTLLDILNLDNKGYEWQYAIAEIVDIVLDLKCGQALQFNHNRDDEYSFAIILRTA